MKKYFLFPIALYLFATICFAGDKQPQVVNANVVKNGVSTPVSFEEDKAVIIAQADEPVAVRFEQVNGYWTFTLYEYKILNLKEIHGTVSSDSIVVNEDSVTFLYHVQTYSACDVPYYVLVPYNFTLQIFCPKSITHTSD